MTNAGAPLVQEDEGTGETVMEANMRYGKMGRTALFVVAIAAFAPAVSYAQAGQPAPASQGGEEKGGNAEARIQAAMEAAVRANIPVSLLESKAKEGEAKGVPAERIAAAVEARLEALMRAQDVLDKAGVEIANEGELLLAAEALRAGVSETALIEVSKAASGEQRAVATAVLTDLVRLGIASPTALARVSAALAGRAESLVNLRAEAAASLRARGELATGLPLPGGPNH
ncbi:MAG TPA: hypothetical protein VF192_17595 [Longimicrobiales bacterium]